MTVKETEILKAMRVARKNLRAAKCECGSRHNTFDAKCPQTIAEVALNDLLELLYEVRGKG